MYLSARIVRVGQNVIEDEVERCGKNDKQASFIGIQTWIYSLFRIHRTAARRDCRFFHLPFVFPFVAL